MSDNFLGQTLGNRYRFEKLIGVGSFAQVYRITDLNRRAVLAAKVLRREISQDPTFLARFQREAAVLARLQHPNIVRYYDIVDMPEDSAMFILMDYIPGTTLEGRLTEPITPSRSLRYLTPLAAALHFAHSEGVIHRDLKPANILLHENGTLYVTDFGIARVLNVTSDLTLGITIGTPYYMAPEQITGEAPITVATDIYALGIILYRMYTGYLPFRGDRPGIEGDSTATRATREQVHADPEPLRNLKPDIDLAVEEIVLRCLEKEPERRYASISDLYDALTEAVGAPPISLDTASQEVVTIDPADLAGEAASDSPPAPPNMKLPEWSQFVPRVDEDLRDDEETIPPPDDADLGIPSSHTAKTPDRIEQPVPQPVTRPHLEDQLQPPDHVAPPDQTIPASSADRTLPGLGRILRRDTVPAPVPQPVPAAAPQQPAYYYADYGDQEYADRPRRNWVLIAAIVGALLVTATVCAATIYLLTTDNESPDPNADLTLTVSGSSNSVTPLPQDTSEQETDDAGQIAFDSRRNGNYDIFIMNVDGTGLRILTGTSGAERGPAWSPDGSQIAFYGASSENDNYDIYIINVDGSGLKNLTNSPTVDDKYPTWSPDGTQLAYHSNADGDYDLYVIETDLDAPDFGPRAITENNVDDLGPDWSPEGTQIVFHTALWGEPYEIGILDLNSGRIRQITNSDNTSAFPTWSPDGTRIAYHVISDQNIVTIYIARPDGSPAQSLNTGGSYSAFPDWSPDGVYIIYHSGQSYESAIYRIPVNGGTPESLTGTQANYLPEWSPAKSR